jgi:ribosomal protein S18 acetylase RimI-like enzyme
MRIRQAERTDVSELARLWIEFGTYYAELDPERFKTPAAAGLEEWIEAGLQRATERWLVAELDGEIAGYAVGQLVEPHPDADLKMLTDAQATRLGIHVVHTSEAFRRRGVATALLRELEAWARQQGAELVLAETDVHSPAAIPFWDQADGYARTSVRFRKRL